MKITAWRIVKARYSAGAFDGEGARFLGGRWNSKGTSVVYTAGSQALAVLEMLFHLSVAELLKHYRLIPVTFDETLVADVDMRKVPATWRRRPTPAAVRAVGDEWVWRGRSGVLRVPSVIVPGESNYLINPRHPDFGKLKIGSHVKYRFDRRLK